MTPGATWAVTARVLAQLRRDPRTLALLTVVPIVLLTLMRLLFDARMDQFHRVGPPLVGIFPLISMFLVTSIAVLRERTSGTLERLMTMPISKLDILLGYALGFAVVAAVQATAAALFAVEALGLEIEGSVALVVAVAVLNALLGMALGLFLSAFAATEFQAVQFMPAFMLPQLLICGLIVERDAMAEVLQWIAAALPMTYAFDALRDAASDSSVTADITTNAAVVVGSTLLALVLGAATLRRRTG